MAKKPTAKKGRKSTNTKTKAQPRRRADAPENASLSVTDGDMKDVIRTAFLRRSL
jgi:hypothetical protein